MKLVLHELARKEYRQAAFYYDEKESGLGTEFALEVEKTLRQISKHYTAWPLIYPGVRACQLSRFEYRVFYCILDDAILVAAISHCKRMPLYWIDRLK